MLLYNTTVNKKEIIILEERISKEFLPYVRKPARYVGGEINQTKKDLRKCDLAVALCFPDVYEIGMSHTGLAIIYDVLNHTDGVAAERIFSPWIEAEKILRDKQIPLFTLESKASLKSFDAIGFSLTNELCYTNVLNILDLGGLNIRSSQRGEDAPLIIGGGGMSNCCEPVAEFFDLFILGEAEETIVQLSKLLKEKKESGQCKKDFLLRLAKKYDWAYVPSLYKFEYDDSTITSFEPIVPGLKKQFQNAVVKDFDNASVPLRPIVPFVQAVHERVSVEIMRGCPGRCRFCQASFCRRPIRYRSVEKIMDIAKSACHSTGFDTVSLLSLSSADYPQLEVLVSRLHEYFQDKHIGLSLPSLRVDQQLKLFPGLLTSVRKGGLTIAVEAANEKVRRIINKPLKNKDLFAAVEAAYEAGWQKLKLYFMVGLPGETEEDIKQIVELSAQLAKLRKSVNGKIAQINVAVSWFVPKAHTPFGWLGQNSKAYFENAKQIILDEKEILRAKFLHFKFHDINCSVLESVIGRADRKLSNVIESAWRNGARFDLWRECFDFQLWQNTFKEFGMDIEAAAQKQFTPDQILPWQHLGGPEKKYLLTHLDKAMEICSAD